MDYERRFDIYIYNIRSPRHGAGTYFTRKIIGRAPGVDTVTRRRPTHTRRERLKIINNEANYYIIYSNTPRRPPAKETARAYSRFEL